jgi:cellulose synthase/poly-beta-1,6-N-acetylglucosamine synthase-like glycosyltransferase
MSGIIEVFTGALLFLMMYFQIFLVYTYFENKKNFIIPKETQEPKNFPSVTIVVPAWNEEDTLAGTLNSLLSLKYPTDKLNIFVVDDGSTDNTFAVASTFTHHPQVKVFHKKNGGKHTVLNFGIKHSTSDLIGCLDADSFVDSNALHAIVPYFDNPEVMAVTPSVQIHNPDNPIRKMQSIEYKVGVFVRKTLSRFNGLYVTPGPFSIYRHSIFEKIGGFEHGYATEDMEMALRMQSNHMRIDNAHNAYVFTVSPPTIPTLYKQRVRWVSGFLKNVLFGYRHMFLNPKYGNLGMLTLPFAFGSIFIALIFTAFWINSLAHGGYENYLHFQATGIHVSSFWPPHFEWFAVDLGFIKVILYVLVTTTIFFLIKGIFMTHDRISAVRDVIYFTLFYAFIAPLWLARSVYNLVTSKDTKWR